MYGASPLWQAIEACGPAAAAEEVRGVWGRYIRVILPAGCPHWRDAIIGGNLSAQGFRVAVYYNRAACAWCLLFMSDCCDRFGPKQGYVLFTGACVQYPTHPAILPATDAHCISMLSAYNKTSFDALTRICSLGYLTFRAPPSTPSKPPGQSRRGVALTGMKMQLI